MADITNATIRYARGDGEALKYEKAYILNYSTPLGIPRSNFMIDFHRDIRDDFDLEETVEKVYLPEVYDCILNTLGATEVYIFDYMIRRRDPSFPFQPASKDNSPQPALSAHIDYTKEEVNLRLQKYFKNKADEFGRRWFQIVNVWKPLVGPLRDYPMAYCDAKTMNPRKDLLVVDEVFPTVANEVYQVLYNPEHVWYYIPDQLENEVAIFAGYDSRRGQNIAVPHCSFDLGHTSSGEPRQSIEVRAFVFYDEC